MELNFTEMNNTQNPYEGQNQDINSQKYWEQNAWEQNAIQQNTTTNQSKTQKPKKKKVTFDDILTNMNLVVNNKGILQFMAPINEEQQYPQQQQQQLPHLQANLERKTEPLDPSVKHSFIFNKYFKDYKDVHTPQREVKVPKTKEEYIQMVIEEKQRQIQERKRIAQIKSKKLLFTSTTNYTPTGGATIQASKNSLRRMSFY
jgi:hypothetical protein